MEQCLLKSVDETLMGIRVEGESVDLWVKIPWIFEPGFVHASPRSIEFASLRGTLGGDRNPKLNSGFPSCIVLLIGYPFGVIGFGVLVMLCALFSPGVSLGVWSRGTVVCHFLGLVRYVVLLLLGS